MTTGEHTGPGLRARWVDVPPDLEPDTLVAVAEALVAAFLWADVPVLRAVEHRLSVVERFLVEAALELGDLTTGDVEEVVGLPAEATDRIAAHLCATGVLAPRGDTYIPDVAAARAALDRETLVELREDWLTFVVLPRTGDALAFEQRRGRHAPPLHRLGPAAQAPVPGPLVGIPRIEVVRGLFDSGRVAGLPDDVVGIGTEPGAVADLVDETCPTYRATGRVRRRDDRTVVHVRLYGDSNERQVPIDLSGAAGLVQSWLALGDRLSEADAAIVATTAALGGEPAAAAADVRVERSGPIHWRFAVGAPAARAALDSGRSLVFGGGLELQDDATAAKVMITAVFEPRDTPARPVFALDRAASLVAAADAPVTPASVAAALASASREHQIDDGDVPESELRRHLWRTGRQDLVYQIRATEDFAYA